MTQAEVLNLKAALRAGAFPSRRAVSGCACATGALEMPALDWKQIGVSLVVGVGLGYVLFATK